VNIIQEVGGRRGLFGIIRNVLNAVFAISFVRKDAFNKAKMDFSRPIWTIAKDAVSALMNAGQGQ
jgi:hypothetical protein